MARIIGNVTCASNMAIQVGALPLQVVLIAKTTHTFMTAHQRLSSAFYDHTEGHVNGRQNSQKSHEFSQI
jgi:hypothetical protein